MKREIHALDFAIARIVALLETILHGDERFAHQCFGERVGGIDIDTSDRGDCGLTAVVRPLWWPRHIRFVITFAGRERLEEMLGILLDVRGLQEKNSATFAFELSLDMIDHPPFFKVNRHSPFVEASAGENYFKALCQRIYGDKAAAV